MLPRQEIRFIARSQSIRQAQLFVRREVAADRWLPDELITERRDKAGSGAGEGVVDANLDAAVIMSALILAEVASVVADSGAPDAQPQRRAAADPVSRAMLRPR